MSGWEMPRNLRILAPTRYLWRFNSPKRSRHSITNRDFLPLNYISPRIEGVTLFPPHLPGQFDLVHAFNRIPLHFKPFIIGFESHLPRGFGMENTRFYSWMTDRLASPQCRAIVAISDWARRSFLAQHAGDARLETLTSKLSVQYPSIGMPRLDSFETPMSPLRLLFVGNHFARKGGCVCLRIAELAHDRGVPIELDIASSLEIGAASWTDPTNRSYFDRYFDLLRLPNVTHHGKLANREVLSRMRSAHFTMLPTFSDTFGFSAVESMANGTPVVGTRQGALPEFIHDGRDGLLLDLPTAPNGEWIHIGHPDRGSAAYENLHRDTVERLAMQGFERLQKFVDNPGGYQPLRREARATAERMFSPERSDHFWDQLYSAAVGNA
jgi:glycosyltransferase involved in cell wall biosynthesis